MIAVCTIHQHLSPKPDYMYRDGFTMDFNIKTAKGSGILVDKDMTSDHIPVKYLSMFKEVHNCKMVIERKD